MPPCASLCLPVPPCAFLPLRSTLCAATQGLLDRREADALERLRLQVGKRPLWVAASTHPGEEEGTVYTVYLKAQVASHRAQATRHKSQVARMQVSSLSLCVLLFKAFSCVWPAGPPFCAMPRSCCAHPRVVP